MAFSPRKKRYKFQVELGLDELVAVTFPSAVVFAKVRLRGGAHFCQTSSRFVFFYFIARPFVILRCVTGPLLTFDRFKCVIQMLNSSCELASLHLTSYSS